MSDVIWWIGAAHLVAYGFAGTIIATAAVMVKTHQWAKVMGRIIQWQVARYQWERGQIDKEPRP